MDINLHIPLIYIVWALVYLVCGLLTAIFMKTKGDLSFWGGVWIVTIWPFVLMIIIIAQLS